MTILLASSVQTLVHCVVKYSRPPDLKSSSNVSLQFAWIIGPATDPSFSIKVIARKQVSDLHGEFIKKYYIGSFHYSWTKYFPQIKDVFNELTSARCVLILQEDVDYDWVCYTGVAPGLKI